MTSEPERESAAPQRNEPLLREAADCTPAPLWLTDETGAMVFANRAFEEQAGQAAHTLMGNGWIGFIHPDDLAAVGEKRAAAWAAGHIAYSFEARFRRHDGAWRWWEVNTRPRFGTSGEFLGYVGLAIDCTDSRAAQEALRESEQRYRAVIENQSEMVCRFRRDGTIVFINSAYARARDATVESLTGANLWAFVTEADREAVRGMLAKLTPEAPEIRIENRFVTADGERWTLWTNRALAFDAEGRWTEAQSTGVDIDERKKAEEHSKLLLDELNHRVKNTLAVVQAIAQQSFREPDVPEETRRIFQGRLSALAHAHNLLTGANWEETPLHDIVESALSVCGAAANRIQRSGPHVLLTPRQALSLTMALHELCTNALKYGALSNAGGGVALTWRTIADPAPRIAIRWLESGGPPVERPRRRGFGSAMIERALAHELGAGAVLSFEASGLLCDIQMPEAHS